MANIAPSALDDHCDQQWKRPSVLRTGAILTEARQACSAGAMLVMVRMLYLTLSGVRFPDRVLALLTRLSASKDAELLVVAKRSRCCGGVAEWLRSRPVARQPR